VSPSPSPFAPSEAEGQRERVSTSLDTNGVSAVPRHVAVIMDGNGRWAGKRHLPRVAGHKAGAEALRNALQTAADRGVEVLTVYAFSSENWRRSEEEVSDLTALMRFYLERELATLQKEGVRLKLIGDYAAFGADLTRRLERAVERTAANRRLTLVIALNYGSRAEIAGAARRLAQRVAAGEIAPEAIDERAVESELDTHELPPLDLLIRTSGEVRLSNFLLWQAAYAELIFVPVLWPDFDERTFSEALDQFAARKRRFGGR
jgi:undecaprenyl diphosphate synthase